MRDNTRLLNLKPYDTTFYNPSRLAHITTLFCCHWHYPGRSTAQAESYKTLSLLRRTET